MLAVLGDLPQAVGGGGYFVRASAPGFAAALYDGLPCAGKCDVTAGAPVTIRVNEETSGIDFELRSATSLAQTAHIPLAPGGSRRSRARSSDAGE